MRCAAFDIGVADAQILDVPVELGLELMAVIRSDVPDAERDSFDRGHRTEYKVRNTMSSSCGKTTCALGLNGRA
jgi:hypothetical protein